jgi:hypothetical protein
MRYLSIEGGPTSVFCDGVGHLQRVTILACLSQSQFIPTNTLFASSTIQIYLVKCTLSICLYTIIKSRNEKASNIFPRLLQPNIMDYFRQVTSWHVSKLLQAKLLQVFSKEDKSYIGIMKMIKQFHIECQGVSHVA